MWIFFLCVAGWKKEVVVRSFHFVVFKILKWNYNNKCCYSVCKASISHQFQFSFTWWQLLFQLSHTKHIIPYYMEGGIKSASYILLRLKKVKRRCINEVRSTEENFLLGIKLHESKDVCYMYMCSTLTLRLIMCMQTSTSIFCLTKEKRNLSLTVHCACLVQATLFVTFTSQELHIFGIFDSVTS